MAPFPQILSDGYSKFRANRSPEESERFRQLAEKGQTPETIAIACCDSRTAPEIVFNAAPGELFVVRNVANLVPPYLPDGHYHGTAAALEFAIQSLGVKNVLVLGHARCGGIQAALNPAGAPLSPGDFIGKWMELLEPVARSVTASEQMTHSERQTELEHRSIHHSVNNLRTFPYIANLEREGRLGLYGAWFDIYTGELWTMDSTSGSFSRLGP